MEKRENRWHSVYGVTASELSGQEREAVRERYGALVDEQWTGVRRHPHQPLRLRAAQFLPFAALSGFEEEIDETARVTQERREPGEERLQELDAALALIRQDLPRHPQVRALCFVPDARKEGGRYEEIRGEVRKVEVSSRTLCFADGTRVAFDDLEELEELAPGEEE